MRTENRAATGNNNGWFVCCYIFVLYSDQNQMVSSTLVAGWPACPSCVVVVKCLYSCGKRRELILRHVEIDRLIGLVDSISS